MSKYDFLHLKCCLYIILCMHYVLYWYYEWYYKESHSKDLSILVYIPDTRFLIYYKYLYGAIDVDGPWWHGHMLERGHIFF